MRDYLLILRDEEQQWDRFSPDDFQRTLALFLEWNEEMKAAGNYGSAGKLTSSLGKTVRMKDKEPVVDGPFCEAKEAVAGFYLIHAESFEHATEIAKRCPIITYGGSVEVREMVVPRAARSE